MPAGDPRPRVLLVDLNNFARFPTLSVGSLTAVLRASGHAVEVLSPLAVGVPGLPRPARAKPWGYWDERLRWWSATTSNRFVRSLRSRLDDLRAHRRGARSEPLRQAFRAALEHRPDVVFVSAYLMYHDAIEGLAQEAAARGVPLVLGGPAFHEQPTRREWLRIEGVTGLYAGEAEAHASALVAAARGGGPDPPGFTRSGAADAGVAPPLQNLDALPFPDYSDFPWHRYPNRIVSMLTGRGCGWGVCRFCSDVVTVAGRTFRSRSAESVVAELRHHRERHETSLFCFSDLKLNSDLDVWRGLQDGFQRAVPGAKWTCAVHVGPRADEGLSTDDLRAARAAGLVRVTTGLETAGRGLLDSMRKGTTPERLGAFLTAACDAGISSRVTAFTGYPGETTADVAETTRFLERFGPTIDRVHLSRLSIQAGTPLERDLRDGSLQDPSLRPFAPDARQALTPHGDDRAKRRDYRGALAALLRAVHRINRRPLRFEARELEGVM